MREEGEWSDIEDEVTTIRSKTVTKCINFYADDATPHDDATFKVAESTPVYLGLVMVMYDGILY